jgi:hypothetical protein
MKKDILDRRNPLQAARVAAQWSLSIKVDSNKENDNDSTVYDRMKPILKQRER